ncbi:restriction endonuclease subunit M [Halomontanus rarus]|uniref:restriction endonuclease subunit M n=1 Tax=Halomontanus rarus TaxID=3034020 RepID=UPI0023E82C01|nr:N-6 DNA methylase [Halovivax sp. TS33]
MSEADLHFEFYRHLANAIENEPKRNGFVFGNVRAEYGENIDGFADIVLFDSDGSPAVVIEAKAPSGSGRSRQEIDPYAPRVIRQAFRYAGDLGAPYFCTFNGDRLVVFDAYEEGVPLLQRSTKSYEISSLQKFASTFLDEISRIRAGEAQWDADDDAFVERIKSLHERVSPELEMSMSDHLEDNDEFRTQFEKWTTSQGIDYKGEDEADKRHIREEFAEQAAYLLVNKVLFYKILESSPTYSDEMEPMTVSPFSVQQDLEEYFTHIVEEIDFEAIFDHDPIYSEIPLDPVSGQIRDFVIELDDQNLTQFDSDVIGRIYEGVIPAERRNEMGEYYTPPAICDLITRLTIDDANASVLDPACGSGGFLVSAYNRKRELFPKERGSHDVILDQMMGVDINRFPAHLSAINLALQELSEHTENVNVEVSDFFNVRPDTQRFGRVVAGAGGETWESGDVNGAVGGFDAVVGNPPYIRGRSIDLDHKDDIRDHLSNVDAEWMTRNMDIYGYFITHATAFLDDGGKLGFIISDRWLDTQYGTDLQRFLLENYRIEAVIKFNKQTFEDALVGSTVVILEKEPEKHKREDHIAKFVEVRGQIGLDEIESVVREDVESDQMIVTDEYRLVANRQENLRNIAKWNVLYMAPPIYFDLVALNLIELQDVAEMHTGLECGSNPFFYRRMTAVNDLGLEEYFTPLLKACGQVSRIKFDDEDAKEWGVLDVNDLVEEALNEDRDFGDEKVKHVKNWLAEKEHGNLLEYIEWGEDNEHDKDSDTCKDRDIWFQIDDLEDHSPTFAIPDFVWTEARVVWNDANAVADRQFHNIHPHNDIDKKLLCGLLNSRLVWLLREVEGRHAGGEGMTRSRMVLYESQELRIPDPRKISEEESEEIKSALDDLLECEAELDIDEDNEDVDPMELKEEERDALDHAVLSTIGLEHRLDDLKQSVEGLVDLRRAGSGDQTEVLVNRTEEKEVIELEGVEEARERTRLTDF